MKYHDRPGGAPESFIYWPKMKVGLDDYAHAKDIMLRCERYKYVSRINGEDEFYNPEADPKETHKRIDALRYQESLDRCDLRC